MAKNVIIDAALELHRESYREDSHQVVDTTENPMVERHEKFLKKHKTFCF